MQPESPVEVDGAVVLPRLGHGDRRTQLVIPLLEKWHDDVQAVGGATLKDRDEDLAPRGPGGGGTHEPRGRQTDAGHRDRGCA